MFAPTDKKSYFFLCIVCTWLLWKRKKWARWNIFGDDRRSVGPYFFFFFLFENDENFAFNVGGIP